MSQLNICTCQKDLFSRKMRMNWLEVHEAKASQYQTDFTHFRESSIHFRIELCLKEGTLLHQLRSN